MFLTFNTVFVYVCVWGECYCSCTDFLKAVNMLQTNLTKINIQQQYWKQHVDTDC